MSEKDRARHHARIEFGAQLAPGLGADHQHAHLIDGATAAVLKIGRQATAGIESQFFQQQTRQRRLTSEGLIPATKGTQQLLQQITEYWVELQGYGAMAFAPLGPFEAPDAWAADAAGLTEISDFMPSWIEFPPASRSDK